MSSRLPPFPLRSHSSLSPAGRNAFSWIIFAFVAWATVLLVIGVRAVHGWTWLRAAAAVAPPLAACQCYFWRSESADSKRASSSSGIA